MIGAIIKDAVKSIPNTVYLRATDYDANTALNDIELKDKTLCIYNNLGAVSHNVGASILRNWPIEIEILQLAEIDDNTIDGDLIRAECMPIGDQIFDLIIKDTRTNQAAEIDDYILNPAEQVLRYDTVMTGVQLEFTLKTDRKACYVQPESTTP